MRLVLTLAALLLAAPAAAGPLTVAVLYFDNNTGQPELDVLQKGFADMMVTDLSAVEGLQVVEREKLEQLLAELKLQRTRYFDPKTAQAIGKGVGAQFAVAGSFAAMDPSLRIDARLVDIASGKVALAAQVVGQKAKLFDLQQELVGKLTRALNVQLSAALGRKTRVGDVDTLLAYSKGVDLADQGKWDEAAKAMADVVQRAPSFGLARERRDELFRRVKQAEERRKDVADEGVKALAKNAQAYLAAKKFDALGEGEARVFLAYRILEGRALVRSLKAHLSRKEPIRVVLRGHEAQALELLRAIAASQRLLVGEAARFGAKYTKQMGDVAYLDTRLPLPPDEQARLRESGLGVPALGKPFKAALGEFLLLGRCEDSDAGPFTVAPSLSDLDPQVAVEGFALFDQAFAEADVPVAKQPHLEFAAAQVLDAHAEALLRKGRTEEAVAHWQKVLDAYPASTQFARFEQRIKVELGLDDAGQKRDLLAYPDSLRRCDELGLTKVFGRVLQERALVAGADAVPRAVAELEKSCQGNPKLKRAWPGLYATAGLFAATVEDCETCLQMFDRYLAAGGSGEDRAAYLKNYASACKR
jgi:TolB-like protein